MIMKQDIVKKIKEYFNLNIYETKVWVALLSKGIASAGEIAEISGVPRSRTYDVLESLEKSGFAIIKIGKPVKYIAVKPVEVIEKIKLNKLIKENEELLWKLQAVIQDRSIITLNNSQINQVVRARDEIMEGMTDDERQALVSGSRQALTKHDDVKKGN